jgi:hypothetical protein
MTKNSQKILNYLEKKHIDIFVYLLNKIISVCNKFNKIKVPRNKIPSRYLARYLTISYCKTGQRYLRYLKPVYNIVIKRFWERRLNWALFPFFKIDTLGTLYNTDNLDTLDTLDTYLISFNNIPQY